MRVFILGSSRSGTTLLNQILSKSKSVLGLNELHFFNEISNPYIEFLNEEKIKSYGSLLIARILRDLWAKVSKDDVVLINTLIEENGLNRFDTNYKLYNEVLNSFSQKQNKSLTVDQTGKNIYFYKTLYKNIPDSRFIYMYRDPRAVYLSQKNRWKKRFQGAKNIPFFVAIKNYVNFHPFTTNLKWSLTNKSFLKEIDSQIPIYKISFEHLVTQPEKEVMHLTNFLNVKFDPSMLDVKIISSSHKQDGEMGFKKEIIKLWESHLSETEIWITQILCKSSMLILGYDLLKVRPNILKLLWYMLTFPIHALGVVLLNFSNVIVAIKKYENPSSK